MVDTRLQQARNHAVPPTRREMGSTEFSRWCRDTRKGYPRVTFCPSTCSTSGARHTRSTRTSGPRRARPVESAVHAWLGTNSQKAAQKRRSILSVLGTARVGWLGSGGVLAVLCETGPSRRHGLNESTGGIPASSAWCGGRRYGRHRPGGV